MENLVKEVIFYSIINSFIVYGIMQTLLRILDKEVIHRFIGLSITYGLGTIMGFMITGNISLWEKFVWGISIGACSVAVYKSAVQSLLNIIPSIMDRLLGISTSKVENKVEEV